MRVTTKQTMSRPARVARALVPSAIVAIAVLMLVSGCPSENTAKGASNSESSGSREGSNLEEQRRNEKNLEAIDEARRRAEADERKSKAAVTAANERE